jgi:glycosyltransferase involved in cell wall biosynthesis
MYCGSCLRDNALAAELKRQGHDVVLLPIYTPTLTDEVNVSHPRVFFGGISVYLQQRWPVFRDLPGFVDRLWDARWALNLATKQSIPTDPKLLGEMTVAMLKGEDGPLLRELAKLLDWLKSEPSPDVIALPYTLLISLAKPLKEALGRPVVCTFQGEDLFLEGLKDPWKSESLRLIRKNIQYVDRFIGVSDYYSTFMAEYLGITPDRIETVPLGIRFDGYSMPERPASGPFRIGFLARIAPEKGLHVLAEAVSKMPDPDGVRVEAAGFLPAEHKPYLARAEKMLGERFHYHGAVDRAGKIRFLQSVDVLSVPSVYREPKGIFLFEAMANGVPVVQPAHGAYPEIVGKTGGGVLVDPSDRGALTNALEKLWHDREWTRELGRRGFAGVREHYSVETMARRTLAVYEQVRAHSYA